MKKYFTFAMALCLLSACGKSDDSNSNNSGQDAKLAIQASIQERQTKASGTSWDDQDKIGVSVSGLSEYTANTNIPYAYDESESKFAAVSTEVSISGALTVSAYYPWFGTENTEPQSEVISTVAAKQTAAEQKTIDYLYATASVTKEAPTANFTFTHKMTMLSLTFEPEDVTSGTEVVNFKVSGFVLDGTFDPKTGVAAVSPTASASDIILSTSNLKSSIILIPQSAEASAVKVALTFDDKTYNGEFTSDFTLSAGNTHGYTVKIPNSQTEPDPDATLEIISNGITDWTPGTGGNIVTEYDAGAEAINPAWIQGAGGNVGSN